MAIITRDAATMRVGAAGWVDYADTDVPEWVNVRLAPNDQDRLVVVELHIARDRIEARWLRKLPIGRIEALANNDPQTAAAIRARLHEVLRRGHQPQSGPPLKPWVPKEVEWEVPPLPTMPATGDKGDDFYEWIAGIYGEAATLSPRPAAELAEAWKQPITTVHRWTREARRRGHLPPGESGRRG